MSLPPALRALHHATRVHQQAHGCNVHGFADGAGLWQLVAGAQPRHILELGTGLGYTACLMALASPLAMVDTLEGDAMHAALARAQIAALGLGGRVRLHEGSFATGLQQGLAAADGYDLAFFDGNMPSLQLVQRLHALLRPGGLLVCANLDLNGPQGARRVKADLADASRWEMLAPLEGGQTRVVRKRGAGDAASAVAPHAGAES